MVETAYVLIDYQMASRLPRQQYQSGVVPVGRSHQSKRVALPPVTVEAGRSTCVSGALRNGVGNNAVLVWATSQSRPSQIPYLIRPGPAVCSPIPLARLGFLKIPSVPPVSLGRARGSRLGASARRRLLFCAWSLVARLTRRLPHGEHPQSPRLLLSMSHDLASIEET